MWMWSVLWWASALTVVTGSLNIEFFPQKRHYMPSPTTEMNCFEYSKFGTHRFGRSYNEDWRYRKPAAKTKMTTYFPTTYPINVFNNNKMMSRRLDKLFLKEDDLVKEHAKLVQDINSLKQVVFVAPFDDTKDAQYDDSIFHEIIETTSTTTTRPTSSKSVSKERPHREKPIKSASIPIIYIGGETTHQVVRSPPISFPKTSINLVGTTSIPFLKHPYPFVIHGSTEKPIRLCMPSLPTYPTTTQRPSLWERLISAILPRPR